MTDAMHNKVGAELTDTSPGRVYLDYYRLSEAPFAITPDPEFLFSSSGHQQVLDKIGYAIDSRMGFVLLTGEVGTGKTTLCRTLLDRLGPKAETVYVINPSLSGHELLASILEDLGAKPDPHATKKVIVDRLNQRLLSGDTNRPFVVVIDDAQTMTPETLEDLRLLSNLETDKCKLIQVVLSGQPELLDMLSNQRLRQLRQRIAVHCRLEPLSTRETGDYISRRLFVAGNQGQVSFSPSATRLIHKTSGGIPRLINKICELALTAGYVKDVQAIAASHVKRALVELDNLDFRKFHRGGRILRYGLTTAAMIVLIAAVSFALRPGVGPPGTGKKTIARTGGGPAQASDRLDHSTVSVPAALANVALQIDVEETATGDSLDAGSDETKDNAVPGKSGAAASADPRPAPYALQLGSFRTLEKVKQGLVQYGQVKMPAHWQMVGDGKWYRIVSGKFEKLQQAAQYKSDHGLEGALIIYAPWSVKVLPRQPGLPDAQIRKFLAEMGYDSLMETARTDDKEIYTGLFGSLEDASITAERINRNGRLLAQVVTR